MSAAVWSPKTGIARWILDFADIARPSWPYSSSARAGESASRTCGASRLSWSASARPRRPISCAARVGRGWASSRPRCTPCRSRESSRARAAQGRAGAASLGEIMIALVTYEEEVALLRERVIAGHDAGDLGVLIGTMTELRACFVGQRDRARSRLPVLRHQRPHVDDAGLLARRRGIRLPFALPRAAHHRPLAARNDRSEGRRLARAPGGMGRARDAADLKLGVCGEQGGTLRASASLTWPASTTSPAPPTTSPSRASRPPRRPDDPDRWTATFQRQ